MLLTAPSTMVSSRMGCHMGRADAPILTDPSTMVCGSAVERARTVTWNTPMERSTQGCGTITNVRGMAGQSLPMATSMRVAGRTICGMAKGPKGTQMERSTLEGGRMAASTVMVRRSTQMGLSMRETGRHNWCVYKLVGIYYLAHACMHNMYVHVHVHHCV